MRDALDTILGYEIWDVVLWGNAVYEYFFAAVMFVVLLAAFAAFQFFAIRYFRAIADKTKTDIDDTFVEIVRSLKPPFYVYLSFYFAVHTLALVPVFETLVQIGLVVWIVYQAVIATQILIDYVVRKQSDDESDVAAENAIHILGFVSKVAIWTLGFLFTLSNLGVNITSLVAGLGIGGIAVALALQNILGELFSSFAIYFDKPFAPGDFIVVGDKAGVVERIGIKTTRIRALQGEEVVISNQDLTAARLQNFKKMKERRVAFSFGVTYETPIPLVEEIPDMVKDIVESVEGARFDRAHFNRFEDSALGFDVVYYIESNDYNMYMDIQQEINIKILRAFEEKGVSMAYPTRTLYMRKG